nr:MAG TPA: hypothetical protein [Caudoviricetes sp.]
MRRSGFEIQRPPHPEKQGASCILVYITFDTYSRLFQENRGRRKRRGRCFKT